MVINDTVTIELRRTGDAAKLRMTVLRHAVEGTVSRQQLELCALYLADQVGKWRDELIEAEDPTASHHSSHAAPKVP